MEEREPGNILYRDFFSTVGTRIRGAYFRDYCVSRFGDVARKDSGGGIRRRWDAKDASMCGRRSERSDVCNSTNKGESISPTKEHPSRPFQKERTIEGRERIKRSRGRKRKRKREKQREGGGDILRRTRDMLEYACSSAEFFTM